MGRFGMQKDRWWKTLQKRMEMTAVNTFFQKRQEHRVTYKSGGRSYHAPYSSGSELLCNAHQATENFERSSSPSARLCELHSMESEKYNESFRKQCLFTEVCKHCIYHVSKCGQHNFSGYAGGFQWARLANPRRVSCPF